MSAVAIIEVSEQASSLERAARQTSLIEDVQTANDFLNKAEAMRAAFARLRNAEDQRISAVRLETALIRRIGQLGGADQFSNQKAQMARALAALSDDAFEEYLQWIDEAAAPIMSWRKWRSMQPDAQEAARQAALKNERIRQEYWERFYSDDEFRTQQENVQAQRRADAEASQRDNSIMEAAANLIAQLDLAGEVFTTRDVAEQVVTSVTRWGLEEETDWAADPDLPEMLRETVRTAMRRTSASDTYPFSRLTVFDGDGQYVHVPWVAATVNHLEAFAVFAQKQADAMQAKADRVAQIAQKYREGLDGRDGSTLLSEVSINSYWIGQWNKGVAA